MYREAFEYDRQHVQEYLALAIGKLREAGVDRQIVDSYGVEFEDGHALPTYNARLPASVYFRKKALEKTARWRERLGPLCWFVGIARAYLEALDGHADETRELWAAYHVHWSQCFDPSPTTVSARARGKRKAGREGWLKTRLRRADLSPGTSFKQAMTTLEQREDLGVAVDWQKQQLSISDGLKCRTASFKSARNTLSTLGVTRRTKDPKP